MVEYAAELLNLESERASVARPGSNLQIVCHVFIHTAYLLLVGELLRNTLHEFRSVAPVVQQYGISLLAVASGSARFLKVSLDGVGA